MKLMTLMAAIFAAGLLMTTGCATHSSKQSCTMSSMKCDGSCCSDPAKCAKCCKDAAGCAKCCKM